MLTIYDPHYMPDTIFFINFDHFHALVIVTEATEL
jgi:hypothetical protein